MRGAQAIQPQRLSELTGCCCSLALDAYQQITAYIEETNVTQPAPDVADLQEHP